MAKSVGITEFLACPIGIGGVLKSQTSDFVVQELDLEKTLAVLTNTVFIEKIVNNDPTELSPEAVSQLNSLVGTETCDKLIRLTQQIAGGSHESMIEIPSPDDKQERTVIHQSIRQYAPMLTSSTDLPTNTIKIYPAKLAHSFNKRQKHGLDSRGAKKQPAKYVKFVMHKENVDTMKALKIIGKATGIKDKCFGVAGNKDKKAITTQNVTVFANYLEKLQNSRLPPNIQIGDFRYTEEELRIGDLFGNKFEIVLREIHLSDIEKLSESIKVLESSGFINYFGLQRFGNSIENSTHSIGLALILKNYLHAVDLILGPRQVGNPLEQQARENWAAYHDVERSLTEFPHFCVVFI